MFSQNSNRHGICEELLARFRRGMDEPNCGWLHEMTPSGWDQKSIPGVMNSLHQKGVIYSHEDEDVAGCYWVEVREGWKA